MDISPPFDPTPPNPLRYVNGVLPPIGVGFDAVTTIARKALANLNGIPERSYHDIDPSRRDTPPGTSTLREYCRCRGIRLPRGAVKSTALALIEMAWAAGLTVEAVPDERFGKVNCYPNAILEKWGSRFLRRRERRRN